MQQPRLLDPRKPPPMNPRSDYGMQMNPHGYLGPPNNPGSLNTGNPGRPLPPGPDVCNRFIHFSIYWLFFIDY